MQQRKFIRKISKYFEMNENEKTTRKNLGNAEKAGSEGNFIAVFKLLSLCYFVMAAQAD